MMGRKTHIRNTRDVREKTKNKPPQTLLRWHKRNDIDASVMDREEADHTHSDSL